MSRATMSERELQDAIVELAQRLGYTHYHAWRSDHSPAGWPDLVLARPPRLIFIEVKSQRGRVSPAQAQWLQLLEDCGQETHVLRPSDWPDAVVGLLRRDETAYRLHGSGLGATRLVRA